MTTQAWITAALAAALEQREPQDITDDFAMPDAGASQIEYLDPATGEWSVL